MIIDFNPYLSCSDPYAHRSVMTAIVKVESGGNPWAININKANQRLLAQPQTKAQAEAWVRWFVANGYNIDIGLAQINIKNIQKFKLDPVSFLEPCNNLELAGKILKSNYDNAAKTSKNSDDAVRNAISAYNTGNFRSGYKNGYVGKVMAKLSGQPIQKNTNYSMIPPLSSQVTNQMIVVKNPTNSKYKNRNSGEPIVANQLIAQNTQKKSNFYSQPGIKVDLWGGKSN